MNSIFLKIVEIVLVVYVLLCGLLYVFQERLIFFPEPLEKNYQFTFSPDFEELNFKAADGSLLNGLLFKADRSNGLIFYLHGNAGSLKSWGGVAKTYTDLNYDVFILDYRGYGKSEGKISGQEQLFEDNQLIYDELKKEYPEQDLIILGYSIGTGMAAKLAADNSPKQLILQAPYYSLTDMMRRMLPIFPTFILKYQLATNEYLTDCEMPITIFHGNQDGVIDYESSLKLKEEFTTKVTLVTLNGQGHNGMTDNTDYKRKLKCLLIE